MTAFIGPPRNLNTAGRNGIAAGSRPPGMQIFNSDNNCIEYNAGTDGTPNWLPLTPNQYGTVFPTTGLFNGYRFTLFLSNPIGGSNMYSAVYRADLDATYPWHVNGPPLVQEVDANDSTTSTSYAALDSTAGPSITLVRAGVYIITIGSNPSSTGSNTDNQYHSFDVGATGAADADAAHSATSAGGTVANSANARPRVKTISAANTAIVSKYRVPGGTQVFWQYRWMNITPIRLI